MTNPISRLFMRHLALRFSPGSRFFCSSSYRNDSQAELQFLLLAWFGRGDKTIESLTRTNQIANKAKLGYKLPRCNSEGKAVRVLDSVVNPVNFLLALDEGK